MRVTRRQWLGLIGAAGAATQLAGCALVGDVTALVVEVEPTRALIAVWASNALTVDLRVTTAAGAEVLTTSLAVDRRGHATVDLVDLTPATGYRVHLTASDDARFGPAAFVTAPADDDPRPMRFAVGADVDPSPEYVTAMFDTIAAAAPDLCVMLGDWPYTDNWPPAIERLDYERRHAEVRLAPSMQPWLRACSFRAIYDDHEFGNDWDGAARALDPRRHTTALAAWDAWFPRRGDGPRYRRWRWGALVECFLLDCRAYRSANTAVDGPDKTMLGAAQLRWLVDGVRASTAPFKLIFTSVPLDYGIGDDHWATFAHERDALLDALAADAPRGVLFVAGDQHWFASHVHRHGARELQVGPLARGPFAVPPPQPGVRARVEGYSVGLIDVTPEPRLRFRALDPDGAVLHDEAFTPDDLALIVAPRHPPRPE